MTTTEAPAPTTPIHCILCDRIDQIPTETLKFMHECVEPGEKIHYTCDLCDLAQQVERDNRKKAAREARAASLIRKHIPAHYREAHINRIHPGLRHLIDHKFHRGTGIILHGPTDCQKSTVAYAILAARILDGTFRSVAAICGSSVSSLLEKSWSQDPRTKAEALAELESFLHADIALIDDLDKMRVTRTSIEWLFEVVRHRTDHQLPMIITTQRTGDALQAQLAHEDNSTSGPAIVRRLRDPEYFLRYRARNGDPQNPNNELALAIARE